MVEHYYAPNLVGSVAIGTQQLTDFYNAKADLADEDLKAMDQIISLQITHQRVDTERVPNGATYVRTIEKGIPQCKFTLRLQALTGEPLHWFTNQCDTTGATPTVHGMDCIYNVPTAALWLAFYFENETSTNAKEYFALMGVTIDSIELVMDTNNFPCEWVITGKAAYEKFGHAALTQVAWNTDNQYMWHHCTFTFTYNSNPVDMIITSVKFSGKNTWLEGIRDSGKYVSAMTIIRSEPTVEVTGWRYADAAANADPVVICRTAPSAYAGALYIKILLARTADNDEIAIIINTCEAQATDRNIDRAALGIEPLVMTLEPYVSWDTTDYIIVKDNNAETQYENNGA